MTLCLEACVWTMRLADPLLVTPDDDPLRVGELARPLGYHDH